MTISMPKLFRAPIAALVFAGFFAPAVAQQPSINAILLAREIIIVKGGSSLYEPMIADVIDRAKGVLLQTNPMLSKDLNEVAAKVKSDAAPRVGELVNEAAKMYAARFTERELKDVLAFYKSPLGQKIITQEPAILDQSVAFAQTWASTFSEQVLAQMRTEMKKRGHDL
ncbi:MAG TPA: DUF2059 domain-containing protein [Xanthobacteraceae bacterium]|jgi:hypothetical protein